ncbi:MAG: hypothetical protein J1E34_00685 [Oscillospiraceae bacterium]|nr:hypothetical protein [Oscillospiraceae bacterium]
METVRFIIHRKAAFAGSLLPYNIYINGQFVGTIKNGKTLNIDVPKSDVYYLEDNNAFERNAVISNCNLSEYHILLKRAGGWRTASYNEFYMDNGQQTDSLPSFHFEKFMNAVYGDSADELSSDELLLAFCLEFWNGITDDIQEILASVHLTQMVDALQRIGVTIYADLLLQILNELFPNIALPLSDEQIDQMYNRIFKANKLIWNNEDLAWDELRKVVVKHITNKLINKENVY